MVINGFWPRVTLPSDTVQQIDVGLMAHRDARDHFTGEQSMAQWPVQASGSIGLGPTSALPKLSAKRTSASP
jgi:hypothetical protein